MTSAKREASLPAGRYPDERPPQSRRRWFLLASVVVLVAGVLIAYVGYTKFADPDVSGSATGYDIIDSSTVDVQFTVTRNDPHQAVSCIVRARSKDGSETGRREVLIPAGTDQQVGARSRVYTSAPPAVGEVFGCTVNVPDYLKGS
ncbi:DUF4307 domain-containing protein [Williamsia sterculiae]|uniref:DUF4307 domain-containing protein n=1 Tax=Williamsia sterculiae TaxID=1344003 RepID=A0A1N7DRS8_9NOCA|nr:DUF4307 domain-containing protein [Williamsia sterculiae]SIR78534.1 protein of unknown function [Williamsia sterculiae]